MLTSLMKFVQSRWYWGLVVSVGLALEGVALFYQYILGEPPCVLCIQARFWILTGLLFGLASLWSERPLVRGSAHVGLTAALVLLVNRSRTSVLVERGEYEGQCGMDAGFPSWLALDDWLPQIFEVQTMCGYTPNFILGLTMGEGLFYAASVLLFTAVCALLLSLASALLRVR
ncbi:disulfide bond formation protein B [Reinekea sp.]|jgi:disulfide bond formation protein DsbB|uniref:disulfide bond formation protein B n=1 Tax=Reinekea sp. TaxID=1970455 RepID=UPI002A828A55|nr:disulfide bond formation protein B [Reinekea sp.]